MKKLIAKIRNKRLKGNISLLVILVLLASSVISLLSINQIQRLMTYGNMTFNYFRAFYLAKAGTELGLTEVYNSEDWFSHSVRRESAIVTWNLLSEYSGFNPYFDMTITWKFLNLTEDISKSEICDSWNKLKLDPLAWIMLSLFYDTTSWTHNILSEWTHNIKPLSLDDIKSIKLEDATPSTKLTFAFFNYNKINNDGIIDYVMDDIVVETEKSPGDLSNFLSNSASSLVSNSSDEIKKYLTIKNSWEQPVEFCVTMDNKLIPYSDFLITVFWHYGDMEVWLQSIIKKWVPDWTLNVIDD